MRRTAYLPARDVFGLRFPALLAVECRRHDVPADVPCWVLPGEGGGAPACCGERIREALGFAPTTRERRR